MLEHLEPKKVFSYFEEICRIPHGSDNIGQISAYLADWAKGLGLSYVQEPCGNLIVSVPATAGYENEPIVILQGHMDMVAVKEADCPINLETEGLEVCCDDEYVFAKGTSLGGDDGIALAYAMAVADSTDIPHPALELLFTVNEETGMDGARELDASVLRGRRLVNLDSEEEGTLLVGCAGGARVHFTKKLAKQEITGAAFTVRLSGLTGGHSGAEIHRNRENAIKLLGRLLEGSGLTGLVALSGGTKDNVIPSEAVATVIGTPELEETLLVRFESLFEELCDREPEMELTVEQETPDGVLGTFGAVCESDAENLLTLLSVLPFGVHTMSAAMEGVVETSSNIGTVQLSDDGIVTVNCSVRSMKGSARDAFCHEHVLLGEALGYEISVTGQYPGWSYRQDSPLRRRMEAVYERVYGTKPQVAAIHAGLECGLLIEKLPDLDCVSLGPDILDIHSTRERLSIASTTRVWNFLLAVLAEKDA